MEKLSNFYKKKKGLVNLTIVSFGLALSCVLSQTALADNIVGGVMPTRGGNSFGLAYDIADGQRNSYGVFFRSIPDNDEKNQNGETFIGGYFKGMVNFGKMSFSGSLGVAYHDYEANEDEKITGFASSLGYGVYRVIKPNIKIGIENMIFNNLTGDLEGRQKSFALIAIDYRM
ncbi:MAG: hypothetical protein AB8G05_28005 [Oligoflexales bacterium]